MTLVDSVAVFESRCNENDDTGQLFILLGRQGLNTFSSMAFAIGTPNQPPTDAVFDQFANRLFTMPSMGQVGKLRRLFFESQTYVLAQLKLAVSGDPGTTQRKLPLPEKQARIADLKTRLNGVVLEGEKEPAHSLIDLCQTIFETGNIVWIHPSKCKKRESEIKFAMKEPKQILKVEQQVVRIDHAVESADAEHGTELKMMWCLQRRGFALDIRNNGSWQTHEKWVDTLFRAYSTENSAATRPISLGQLIKADCELWTLFAREFQSVRPTVHGEKPLDAAITRLQSDPRIVVHLMPLPAGRVAAADTNPADANPDPKKKKKRPGKRTRVTRASPNVPDELKDMHQQTSQGKPICCAFNLKQGCKPAAGGNPPACSRGAHVCAYCRKLGHGAQTCRNYNKTADSGKHRLFGSEQEEFSPTAKRPKREALSSSTGSSSKRESDSEPQQISKRQKVKSDDAEFLDARSFF